MIWLAAIAGVLAAAAIAAGPLMSRVEQPKYVVVKQAGSIEIRNYPAMIVAQTEVSGPRKAAIEEGFRLIAAYIFGANSPNTKIAMTAPVQQQAREKVAMTAPVTQQGGEDHWTIRFIMPANRTLDTLPLPNDKRVHLRQEPAKRILAIRFSGLANDDVIGAKTVELRDYASRHDIKTTGVPLLALYNPPWTLPIFRRNEIMLDVRADAN